MIITKQNLIKQFDCYAEEVLGRDWVKPLPKAFKERKKFEVLIPLPTHAEYEAMRRKKYTYALSSIVADAFSVFADLGDELQNWYDSMPENLQNGDKGSQLAETADTLSGFCEPDIPEWLVNLPVFSLPSLDATSRSAQCAEAVSSLQEALDAINDVKLNKRFTDGDGNVVEMPEENNGLEALCDDLETYIGEAEGVEFPGMCG